MNEGDLSAPIDPPRWRGAPDYNVGQHLFNGLVRLKPGAKTVDEIEPDLAERWETSSDGLVWTFHLRKGVQFHRNYGELTAEDVSFSFERANTEGMLFRTNWELFEKTEAVAPYTVKITLKQPDPTFLQKVLDWRSSMVVSKKAVTELGEDFGKNPVGTGAFQFVEYIPKERVVLSRFDNYFRGAPKIERIEIRFLPDKNVRALALRRGELDMAAGELDAQWTADLERDGFKTFLGAPFTIDAALNMYLKEFSDKRVREAVAHAVNQQDYKTFFGPFVDVPHISPFPNTFPEYQAAKGKLKEYPYDPAKAKQLLAEAGYPNGFQIKGVMTRTTYFLNPAQVLQEQLRAVGIDWQFDVVDHAAYRDAIDKLRNPISYLATLRADPETLVQEWYTKEAIAGRPTGLYNWSGYGDVILGIDDLFAQARRETAQAKRTELFVQIQQKIREDLPVVTLGNFYFYGTLAAPYVDLGYEPQPLSHGAYIPRIRETTVLRAH